MSYSSRYRYPDDVSYHNWQYSQKHQQLCQPSSTWRHQQQPQHCQIQHPLNWQSNESHYHCQDVPRHHHQHQLQQQQVYNGNQCYQLPSSIRFHYQQQQNQQLCWTETTVTQPTWLPSGYDNCQFQHLHDTMDNSPFQNTSTVPAWSSNPPIYKPMSSNVNAFSTMLSQQQPQILQPTLSLPPLLLKSLTPPLASDVFPSPPPSSSSSSSSPAVQIPMDQIKENSAPGKISTTATRRRHRRQPHDKNAVKLLNDWYAENRHHPYADTKTVHWLSRETKLSDDQVRRWMSNTRQKYGDSRQDHGRKKSTNITQ